MQHLDEGTIHAWLDGALTAEEAARVQRHARDCADCAALIAEARGLVAGATRILSALDDVPAVAGSGRWAAGGGASEAAPLSVLDRQAPRRPPPSAPRPLWSRPSTLAVAASVVLMAGSALVLSRSGGVDSLARSEADSVSALLGQRAATEAAADAATAGPPAEGRGGSARDGVTGGTASRREELPAAPQARPAPRVAPANAAPRPTPLSARVDPVPPRATTNRFETRTAPVEVVTSAAAGGAAARKEARADEKAAQVDTTPAADFAAADPVDTAAARRRAAARRAASRRAAAAQARPEQAAPAAVAEASRLAVGRDTVYRARTDTVTVSRVDTQLAPGLRGAGGGVTGTRAFPVTGCYEVVEGRLRGPVTLTTARAWSGGAEQRFVANAPGAIGYWSQPRSGDVHLVIAGALVTARVDAATGELRGKVQRGGKSERFVARRC